MRLAIVTLENGYSWKTRINGTIESIKKYFLNKEWDCEPFPSEKKSLCIDVKVSEPFITSEDIPYTSRQIVTVEKILDECDYDGRSLAIDHDGNLYCDVNLDINNPDWYTMTYQGEPNFPVLLFVSSHNR